MQTAVHLFARVILLIHFFDYHPLFITFFLFFIDAAYLELQKLKMIYVPSQVYALQEDETGITKNSINKSLRYIFFGKLIVVCRNEPMKCIE